MDNSNRPSPEVLQAKQRFGIIGNAPALTAAVERTLRVAPIDLSVLITGESGSGKEFFPKIIHNYSSRKHAKYIAVNCGAIPEGTIDSELFGHEKGSFTGAVASRKGYFEEADGGTIFLDEVAELPLTTQARLLRVLENHEFLKVGSSTIQTTNVRIVAATNVDMIRAVEEGRFREDLYYRLSTVQITIPPLRERGGDIALLARKFATDFAENWRLPQISFTEEARAIMTRYRWPGNVRQLKNVVEQIATFEAGKDINSDILRGYLPAGATIMSPAVIPDRGHAYEHEREMLFSLIMRLQARIDDLEQRLEDNSAIVDSQETSLMTSKSLVPQTSRLSKLSRFTSSEEIDTPFVSYDEPASSSSHTVIPTSPVAPSRPISLEERERQAIIEALERNGGHRGRAADELSISQRTLYRKIKEYGIE